MGDNGRSSEGMPSRRQSHGEERRSWRQSRPDRGDNFNRSGDRNRNSGKGDDWRSDDWRRPRDSAPVDSDPSDQQGSRQWGRPTKYQEDQAMTTRASAGGEDQRHIQHFYNMKRDYSDDARMRSGIYGVRVFNNLLKSMLIDRYSRAGDVVLDLGCGRGGDLFKWQKACIRGMIGIDIADVSLEYARGRYAELHKKTFWCDFCAGDPFTQELTDIVPERAFPVDTVSCQFALHYAFATEEKARMAMHNISTNLRQGGSFFGTIPSSRYLSWNLRNGRQKWGNSIFKIEFDEPNPKGEFPSMYGNRYQFFLAEAVEDVPEYVIPYEGFIKLAKEYGLELVLYKSFLRFYQEMIRSPDMLRAAVQKGVSNHDGTFKFGDEQKEACEIYDAFVFIKR